MKKNNGIEFVGEKRMKRSNSIKDNNMKLKDTSKNNVSFKVRLGH